MCLDSRCFLISVEAGCCGVSIAMLFGLVAICVLFGVLFALLCLGLLAFWLLLLWVAWLL